MRRVVVCILCLSSFAFAEYGVLKGERNDGMTKTCFYNVPSGTRSITIGASEICPVSYDF